MKRVALFAWALFVLGLGADGAIVPVAVWEGDFPEASCTDKGFSVVYHDGNEVIENYDGKKCIRIGNSDGLGVSFGTNGWTAISAIFKYEALPDAGSAEAVAAFTANSVANRTAVLRTTDGYAATLVSTASAPAKSNSFTTDYAGVLAVGYDRNKTGCYTGLGTTLCDDACGVGSEYISAVTIGGGADKVSNYPNAMVGLKILAVAIFDKKVTAAEVAAYKFPSDEDDVEYVLQTAGQKWVSSTTAWKVNGSSAKWANGATSVAKIDTSALSTAGSSQKGLIVDGAIAAKSVVFTGSKDFAFTSVSKGNVMPINAFIDARNYKKRLFIYKSSSSYPVIPINGKICVGPGVEFIVNVASSSDSMICPDYDLIGDGIFRKWGSGELVFNEGSLIPSISTIYLYLGKLRFVDCAPSVDVEFTQKTTSMRLFFEVSDGKTVSYDHSITEERRKASETTYRWRVHKTGSGTLILSKANQINQIDVEAGTVVVNGGPSDTIISGDFRFGPLGVYYVQDASDDGYYIYVRSGAAVDVNGYGDMHNSFMLYDGATLKNGSSISIRPDVRQYRNVALQGNAMIDAYGDFGLHAVGRLNQLGPTKVDLGAYTLTKQGVGNFHVVNCTVSGAGTIDVVNGGFRTYGTASTATDATMKIREAGALQLDADFSVGNLIVENGEVYGDSLLTVGKSLDVSKTDTKVAKLTLADGVSLTGTKLTVKQTLTLGSSLKVVVPDEDDPSVVKIANVPSGTSVAGKTVTVNGKSGYVLYLEDTELKVKKSTITTGRIVFDTTEICGGCNFTNAVVNGAVKYFSGTGSVWLQFLLKASDGSLRQYHCEYNGTTKTFPYTLDGLTPGEFYAIDVYMSKDQAGLDTSNIQVPVVAYPRTKMSETDVRWIRENVATYAGDSVGSGVWDSDANVVLSNECVAVRSADMYHGIYFTPTNAPSAHDGCEYRTTVEFHEAATELEDDVSARFGVTLYDDGASGLQLVLVSSAGWKKLVSRTDFAPELDTPYTFTFVASESKGVVNCFVRKQSEKDVYVGSVDLEGSEVASRVSYLGAGAVSMLEGDGYDTRLVTVDLDITSTPGTNFAAVASKGTITVGLRHETTHTKGKIRVSVRDSAGGVIHTEDFSFASLGSATSVDVAVDGLIQGEVYSVDVEVLPDAAGGDSEAEASKLAPMAKAFAWIHEDADTFESLSTPSGVWNDDGGMAAAIAVDGERRIVFSGKSWDVKTGFVPYYGDPAVTASGMREIVFKASFDRPGYFVCDDPPEVEDDVIASITLAADDKMACSFAVLVDGEWQTVGDCVDSPDLGKKYDVGMRFDYVNGVITYFLNDGNDRLVLASTSFESSSRNESFAFSGSGSVSDIDGQCADANLMRVGENEYWSFVEAREAAGESSAIEPLWWSSAVIDDKRGAFRILDPNGYFTPIFATWYHVVTTAAGKARIYRYVASNNWIDYADADGLEEVVGGWKVKTPEGFAYLAAESTNGWISGTITLEGDLDLAECNWTPIARFTGVFDGNGHHIIGLNNTNVIDELGLYMAYPDGVTNEWGHSAYGLFATTVDASLGNVYLDDVAITNTAESVAALVGVHEGGDLSVSQVAVTGTVHGTGGKVAGVVGLVEDWNEATISGNLNEADVSAAAEYFEDPRWVAGVATIGGTNEAGVVGKLTATGNENRGQVANTVYNNDNGGNVAQILAGTKWDSRFGDVALTGNAANGTVDALVVDGDAWLAQAFPICNLAAAMTRVADEGDFGRFVEANEVGSIPVDPANRTARMLYGKFANGARNIAGEITDMVSSTAAGETLTIPWTKSLYDTWDAIRVDRNITIDLGGSELWTVGDCHTFVVTNGAAVTVKNGKITYAKGYKAYEYTSPASVVNGATTVENEDDFYGRTVPASGLGVASKVVSITIAYTNPEWFYCVDQTESLAGEWRQNVAYAQGNGGTLTIEVPVDSDSAFFRIRLSDYIDE